MAVGLGCALLTLRKVVVSGDCGVSLVVVATAVVWLCCRDRCRIDVIVYLVQNNVLVFDLFGVACIT